MIARKCWFITIISTLLPWTDDPWKHLVFCSLWNEHCNAFLSLFLCRRVLRINVLMLCCCFIVQKICVSRCYLGILIVTVYFPQLSRGKNMLEVKWHYGYIWKITRDKCVPSSWNTLLIFKIILRQKREVSFYITY